MSFKVSAAPFHFWTPDVYDGAPTVFTSFMATIVKAAVFIAFIRLFDEAFGAFATAMADMDSHYYGGYIIYWQYHCRFSAKCKKNAGLFQYCTGRFYAAVIICYEYGCQRRIAFISAAYSLATIGIFAVLIKMNDYTFDGFNGLAKHQPLLAATTTIFLLSLAGIPLTAGFIAKFYMLKAAMATGKHFWLVIFAVLMAAVSVYYYFRVIQAMYFKEGHGENYDGKPGI